MNEQTKGKARPRKCPIPGCAELLQAPRFLCRGHWYQVPQEMRTRIWTLFRTEPGSDKHRAAVFSAIRDVTVQALAKAKRMEGTARG